MAAASLPASAQGTHLWTQSRLEEFEKGTPQGVAITSDGHLIEGPGLTELATTPSTYVWSVAVDKVGVAFVGTASPATVLRIAADGKAFTLFETKDLAVQVVRLGPDGALDAAKLDDATANDGRTAAEKNADKGADKSEAKTHYIWEMSFDASGRLYIA